MRTLLSALLLTAGVTMVSAAHPQSSQLPPETSAQKEARLQWWTEARFGMFIHWGLDLDDVPGGWTSGRPNSSSRASG
ncbi:MAG TPA: alpha-L-fucosidase [Vicinamibacterales bacterium]|jgi:alpha-L-fucosidase